MKRFLLPLLPFLICSPASAAEVELWQGVWSGMTKAQVAQRTGMPFIKCEASGPRTFCDTRAYLPLGTKIAPQRGVFDNGKLFSISIGMQIKHGCTPDNLLSMPPEKVKAIAPSMSACMKRQDTEDNNQMREIVSALIQKYGQPTTRGQYINQHEWSIRGTKISIMFPLTGWYAVIYQKDTTYGSL
jgi:hypothetical protein